MTPPILAFYNNAGRVGTTSLVYHLSWIFSDLGLRVLAVDLDPQASLSAAFLDEGDLEPIWDGTGGIVTIHDAMEPLIEGRGDFVSPTPVEIADDLHLLVGDLRLSNFEDELSVQWPLWLSSPAERPFQVTSALPRIVRRAAEDHGAEVVLMDLGPNLGALNRSALGAADFILVPLSIDLLSLQGLRTLGPRLRVWRQEWVDRRSGRPDLGPMAPLGAMSPAGYVVLQQPVRLDRPNYALDRWAASIPCVYRSDVLGNPEEEISLSDDPHCLGVMKTYPSLTQMAGEARKPVFHLKPADGAFGAHMSAVIASYHDYKRLARRIAAATGVRFPDP